MKLEVLDRDMKNGKMVLLIKGTSASFVNALRRSAIEDVATLAIEDVELRKNSSVLYDEIIALRLGLLPLTTDLKSYNLPEACACKGEGCAQCELKFTLKTTGPGIVYASELVSSDPKIKPVYPETPIVKLLKGQKIELEATARMGTGKAHMKWAPGLVYYKHFPKIKAGSSDKAKQIAGKFPAGTVKAEGNKLSVDANKLAQSHYLDAVDALSEGAITAEDNNTDFIMFIESWGQMSPKDILQQAAATFRESVELLEKDLQA